MAPATSASVAVARFWTWRKRWVVGWLWSAVEGGESNSHGCRRGGVAGGGKDASFLDVAALPAAEGELEVVGRDFVDDPLPLPRLHPLVLELELRPLRFQGAGQRSGGGGGDNPNMDPSCLLPFLRSLSSLPPLRISSSAPVTPPLSSPTAASRPPHARRPEWDFAAALRRHPICSASAPASPTRALLSRAYPAAIPECDESDASTVDSGRWLGFPGTATAAAAPPASPTFNLVSLAAAAAAAAAASVPPEAERAEFEFENQRVKAWEGERIIHEVGADELELTLGSGKRRHL